MVELIGKRVLVVGGSSGIGLAAARLAQAAGAIVSTASRSGSAVGGATGLAHFIMDVSNEADVIAKLGDLPKFDHLVITAGGAAAAPFRGRGSQDAEQAFATKFWGAWRVASHAPLADQASITLVSGVFAERPAKRNVAACCANAAIEGLARSLAVELAPVRVNAVSPGLVDTPMWSAMPDDRRAAYFSEMAAKLPAGRICTAEDIAGLILMCMVNPVLTGAVLKADGGYTLV